MRKGIPTIESRQNLSNPGDVQFKGHRNQRRLINIKILEELK